MISGVRPRWQSQSAHNCFSMRSPGRKDTGLPLHLSSQWFVLVSRFCHLRSAPGVFLARVNRPAECGVRRGSSGFYG